MKVKDIIEAMSGYHPEEELIIDWWDKSCFDHICDDRFDDEEQLSEQTRLQLWNQTAESFRLSEHTTDAMWEDIWDALSNPETEDEDKVA